MSSNKIKVEVEGCEDESSGAKRRRKWLALEEKIEIIQLHEDGMSYAGISR